VDNDLDELKDELRRLRESSLWGERGLGELAGSTERGLDVVPGKVDSDDMDKLSVVSGLRRPGEYWDERALGDSTERGTLEAVPGKVDNDLDE